MTSRSATECADNPLYSILPYSSVAGSAGFRSGVVAATGQSLLAGSLLVRREAHDEVFAGVGAVGRTGFLRTGNGRRFRSVGFPGGGEL
jgi:hypothetical protein